MKNWKKPLLTAASLGLAVTTTGLAAMAAQGMMRQLYVNDEVGRNVVVIESRAPLETMVIRTNAITASLSGDASDIFKTGKARFELDATKLDTGIEMRNEHMRGEQWLNTAKYPKVIFTLDHLSQLDKSKNGALSPNVTRTVMAEGKMELLGQTRPLSARVELTAIPASEDTKARLPGDLLHIRSNFQFKLSDFGLNVPKPVQLKIANQMDVTVDVFANTDAKNPFPETETPTKTAMNNPNELQIEDLKVGDGAEAKAGQTVTVNYRGTLNDGTLFDQSYGRAPFNFRLGAGEVIQGWDKGVAGMKVGGKRKLTIPPALGYGAAGTPGGPIPPNATLVFEVELLNVK